MPDLAMRSQQDVTIGADVQPKQELALSKCLFDRLASWQAMHSDLLAPGLTLAVLDADTIELEWKTTAERGAQHQAPTTIKLLVPSELIDKQSGWHFKAELVSNFMSSAAHQSIEPLATPFFKSLMTQGLKVERIENAVLSDATIDLNLAPEVTIASTHLNASLELKCHKLHLEDVKISDSKITFDIEEGTWRRVVAKGDKTHFLGHLRRTEVEASCSFSEIYWNVDLKGVAFHGDDLLHRMRATIFSENSTLFCPELVARLKLTPITPEQERALAARIAAARWSDVAARDWSEVNDRVGDGSKCARSQACIVDR